MRLRSGDKHHLRKSSDRKAQIRKAFVPLTGLICAFRFVDFLRWCLSPERNLTDNLFFLLPIVFGINYRKRGSASYIVREVLSVRERERDTEKDGSDATIVALKLAMSLHLPLPKIRTNGDEFTLSLAKNSHFLFLPSHFPSLPSLMVTIVALKFAMSSHFRCQKTCPSWSGISQMARAARRVIENLRQMIKSCPVLHCSSHRKTESN